SGDRRERVEPPGENRRRLTGQDVSDDASRDAADRPDDHRDTGRGPGAQRGVAAEDGEPGQGEPVGYQDRQTPGDGGPKAKRDRDRRNRGGAGERDRPPVPQP